MRQHLHAGYAGAAAPQAAQIPPGIRVRQSRAQKSLAEHRAIYEAIAAHDGDEAERLTIQHVRTPGTAMGDIERNRHTRMGLTIAQKIIKAHMAEGSMEPGQEVGLRIDQTLTQDATGTMAYLEFETMGIDRVKDGALRGVYRPQHPAVRL